MIKKLLTVVLIAMFCFGQSIAQQSQLVYSLSTSCYVNTQGKIIFNSGSQPITDSTAQIYLRDSLHTSAYDTINLSYKNIKNVYFTYDAGGMLLTSTTKAIDKSGTHWNNSQQIGYNYEKAQLLEETYKSWSNTVSDWVNVSKTKYQIGGDLNLSGMPIRADLIIPPRIWSLLTPIIRYPPSPIRSTTRT